MAQKTFMEIIRIWEIATVYFLIKRAVAQIGSGQSDAE